jgi:hypothetical protein
MAAGCFPRRGVVRGAERPESGQHGQLLGPDGALLHGFEGLRGRLLHAGQHQPGLHDVDRDAARRQVAGGAPRAADEPGLGRGVVGEAGQPDAGAPEPMLTIRPLSRITFAARPAVGDPAGPSLGEGRYCRDQTVPNVGCPTVEPRKVHRCVSRAGVCASRPMDRGIPIPVRDGRTVSERKNGLLW